MTTKNLENKIRQKELSRRDFLKKGGKAGLGLLAAYGFGSLANCKKKTPFGPDIPIEDDYTVTVECLDMTSLQGGNFVNKLLVSDAQVIKSGTLLPVGQYTFQHTGHNITLDYTTGSVHDDVLCVRKPGDSTNIYQTQNNNPASINLQNLMQGNNINLELYKIPSWVNINWVKEALSRGTAIYNHDVTVFLANEGYTQQELDGYLPYIRENVNNVLNQVSPCTGTIIATLNESASSGDLKVRLSPHYVNPGHGESGSGIMTQSEIKIRANVESPFYLEELYQAMGVRNDVGADLRDNISDWTDTLNNFGKALMRINYFLNPNTNL